MWYWDRRRFHSLELDLHNHFNKKKREFELEINKLRIWCRQDLLSYIYLYIYIYIKSYPVTIFLCRHSNFKTSWHFFFVIPPPSYGIQNYLISLHKKRVTIEGRNTRMWNQIALKVRKFKEIERVTIINKMRTNQERKNVSVTNITNVQVSATS